MILEIVSGVACFLLADHFIERHKKKKEQEKEEIIREVEERIRKNDEMQNKMGAFEEGSPKM